MSTHADKSLQEALQEFERVLETPIVPGELVQWIRDAAATCGRVGTEVVRQQREGHAEILGQISREDTGLLQRVQMLREEDERLRDEYRELREQARQLDQQADSAEPNEREMDDLVSQFIRRGLDFVIRVRKQEIAMETWLVESFDRDRGVAD